MALMIMPFQVGLFAGPLDMTLMIPTIINIISINIIHDVHIDALALSIFLYQLNQNFILLLNIVSDSCIDFLSVLSLSQWLLFFQHKCFVYQILLEKYVFANK